MLPLETVEQLNTILQKGDSKEIAETLRNLDLLPSSIGVKEAQQLIDGRHGTQSLEDYSASFELNGSTETLRGRRNYLCSISIDGNWDQCNVFIYLIDLFICEHRDDFPLLYQIYQILYPFIQFYFWIEEEMPIQFARMALYCIGKGIITTKGLNGEWSYRSPHFGYAGFRMFGFIGIWIQDYAYDWARGFATFVKTDF